MKACGFPKSQSSNIYIHFQTNQNVSGAAVLRAGSAPQGSRESRPQLLLASPLEVGGHEGTGQVPAKQQGFSRKPSKWWDGTEHCRRGRETEAQLEAALRLSGHHREAAASRPEKHIPSPGRGHGVDHSHSLHQHGEEALRRRLWN